MTEFTGIKKILIIKLRHIGDVLLTVPAIRAVRETFPEAYIAALVNKGTEDMLTGNPLLDGIIRFDRDIPKLTFYKRALAEIAFARQIRSMGFDMTIDLTSGDRPAIYSYLSGARYRIAYDPGKKGMLGKRYLYTHLAKRAGDKHTVIRNLDLLRQFSINTDNHALSFFIPELAEASVKRLFSENNINIIYDRVVHAHPTSRWLFKCWKDEYMAEVIRWLTDNGIKVVVTSSPDNMEIEKAKRILSLVGSRFTVHGSRLLDLCGKTTIKDLAAISNAADLFLGVDTAPMHIAAAIGTPVIALFGTGEKHWGPWGEGHIIISKEAGDRTGMSRKEYIERNLASISPDDVIKEIKGFFIKHNL